MEDEDQDLQASRRHASPCPLVCLAEEQRRIGGKYHKLKRPLTSAMPRRPVSSERDSRANLKLSGEGEYLKEKTKQLIQEFEKYN